MSKRFGIWNDREEKMANPSGQNAPNKPDETTKNIGGKTEIGKTEGGTQRDPEDTKDKDTPKSFAEKLGPDKISSPSQEDADKIADKIEKKETKEGDRVVLTSSISEEDAEKSKAVSTEPVNFTQNLTGVPGNVDLTQGGRLNSDKSVRLNKTIEEINAEIEKTAGPNPSPNRDGNEILKATNGIFGANMVAINENTNAMADRIKELVKKDKLDDKDREELKGMEQRLRDTGKVA